MTDILTELSPQTHDVEVTLPYGKKITVTMYAMSPGVWDRLGDEVKDPLAPYVDTRNGQEIRNYNDPDYLQKRRRAEAERAYRRLTYALLKACNTVDGTLFDEQVQAVKERLDLSIAMALIRWQTRLIAEGQARVLTLASTFQREATPEAADDAALEAVADAVADAE